MAFKGPTQVTGEGRRGPAQGGPGRGPTAGLAFRSPCPPAGSCHSSSQFLSFSHYVCPTPCDPMDCSTPGFPVLHCLPEFAQIHVHRVGDATQPSHPLSSPLLLPSIFPNTRVFSSGCLPHVSKYWSFSISPSNEYSGLMSDFTSGQRCDTTPARCWHKISREVSYPRFQSRGREAAGQASLPRALPGWEIRYLVPKGGARNPPPPSVLSWLLTPCPRLNGGWAPAGVSHRELAG